MWVDLTQLALFVVVVNVSTAAAQVTFAYRFYDTIQCDHNAPTQSTFPPNGGDALSGSQDQCISGPSGGNWNVLEVSNPGGLNLFTFCGMNCQGNMSPAQSSNLRCFSPAAPNCNIGSFLLTAGTPTPPAAPNPPAVTDSPPTPAKSATPVLQTTPATGTSSPTQALQTSKSTTENATSSPLGAATSLPAQSSNPSTPNATSPLQVPLVAATSSVTQSPNTPKSNLGGTVAGGVVAGVIAIAGLIFLHHFLRQRAMKRRLIAPYGLPELATPTSLSPFYAGTTLEQSIGPHFTPVSVQTTGKFVTRADRNSGSAYSGNTSSAYGGLLSPLPLVRKDSEVRLSQREGPTVESPPAYTRQVGA